MVSYILAVLAGLILLAVDQYTKILVSSNFELGGASKELISGVIDLTYIHNDGGAWGMLGGYTWLLLSVTVIIMLVCITMLLKFGFRNKLMFWAINLVLFGGIGNMIDRIFRDGNVIDFIHLSFFPQFPVFNIADCGIVIGACLLALYFVLDMIKDNRERKKAATASVDNEQD